MRSPIFYDSDNTAYYVNAAGTDSYLNHIRTNRLKLDGNYGHSIFGSYSASRYQGVWSMGEAFALPDDGTTTGNLYGIAWSHPNAGGIAGNLASHGMLILENGTFKGAWGGGRLTTPSDIRGTIFYDYDDTGYYCNPNGVSRLSGIQTTNRSGNWNTDFQNTPADSFRYGGDINSGTDCPTGGGWWVQNNYRHSNASNYWGVQVAWGWEDKANELYTRNVSGNVFGSWVRYSNSTNGGRVLLATLTGSNSTTLATTALAGYRYIEILFSNIVPVTTSTILQLQWYAGSYLATGYQQYLAIFNTGGSQGYNQTTYVDLCGGGRVSNSAGSGYCGRILLFNANQGTGFKQFIVDTGGLDSTTNYVNRTWGQGNLNTATAITGFQMFMSSGNISTGTVQVWGWN